MPRRRPCRREPVVQTRSSVCAAPDRGRDGVRHRRSAALRGRARGLGPAPQGGVAADGAHPRRAAPDRGRRAAEPEDTEAALDAHPRTTRGCSRSSTSEGEADFSYAIAGCRASASTPSASAGASRSSAARSRSRCGRSRTSGCPPVIRKLAEEPRGIILLTGHDRLGQVDDAGGDDRPHQLDRGRATSSRSRTRSSTCTATSARSSTSARSARTPRASPGRCAGCCARTPT